MRAEPSLGSRGHPPAAERTPRTRPVGRVAEPATVLDDYSRYIVAWTLRTSDVTETLDLARAKTGVDRVRVVHRPRLLSDNGPCFVSPELAEIWRHALGTPTVPLMIP